MRKAVESSYKVVSESCRRRSLLVELLGLQLLFAVTIGILAFGSIWWISGRMIDDNMRTWSEQWVSRLDDLGAPLYLTEDTEEHIRIENLVDQFPEVALVRYYSATGDAISTGFPFQGGSRVPLLESTRLLDLVDEQSRGTAHIVERIREESPIVRISKPIWTESLRSDGLLGFDFLDDSVVEKTLVGFVELALDFSAYQTRLHRNILLGGIASLVALLLLTIASWYIYRRALLPLSGLQRALEKLAESRSDFNVEITGHREIVAIADALNTTVSALNERDRKLWHLANHDALTGLINRNRFSDLFKQELQKVAKDGTQSALLFIDLDQFKYVNDTVGHAAGDQLLRNAAIRLKSTIGNSGIVARFGGDEFLVLISNTTPEQLVTICKRVRRNLRECRFIENDASIAVSCSIGVAVFDDSHTSLSELLAQSDLACHHAKELGRNQYHFFQASGSDMRQMEIELGWSQRIKSALREDLFVLRYQPIADLRTGEPVFYEALIRMLDKSRKLIQPSAFLPAANRFGLMAEIDEWVIRNSLAELGKFRSRYGDVRFTLNVSGSFIESSSFCECLTNGLERNSLPLDAVVIEITEQTAVASIGGARKNFAQLSDKGLKFAIDDFGAGYSSYSYLKGLPVDFIKIDGSFIKQLAGDEVDQAIVHSIAQIARATGKKTIAEHVQDFKTMRILRDIGVDYAQGYFLGKPSARLRREPVQVYDRPESERPARMALG